jgi:hypothetical protein
VAHIRLPRLQDVGKRPSPLPKVGRHYGAVPFCLARAFATAGSSVRSEHLAFAGRPRELTTPESTPLRHASVSAGKALIQTAATSSVPTPPTATVDTVANSGGDVGPERAELASGAYE